MNKKPPELHVISGNKRTKQTTLLPESIKQRIPQAEWMDNPDSFDKQKFIAETSDYLFTVYGIGSDQDKHTLTMLADHIETYVQCQKGIKAKGILTAFNDGKTIGQNPYITVRNNTTKLIIHLMNELGLTPRGRLAAGKSEDDTPLNKLLKGVIT